MTPELYTRIHDHAWEWEGYCADNAYDICMTAIENEDAQVVECLMMFSQGSDFHDIWNDPAAIGNVNLDEPADNLVVPCKGKWTRWVAGEGFVYHVVPVLDGEVLDVQLSSRVEECVMDLDDYENRVVAENDDIDLSFYIGDFSEFDF